MSKRFVGKVVARDGGVLESYERGVERQDENKKTIDASSDSWDEPYKGEFGDVLHRSMC